MYIIPKFYGKAWRAYRATLIRVRGNRCSTCGRIVTKYLQACHTSHNPRTSSVALMCPACHRRHDAPFALGVARRNRAKRDHQGWLWPELAYDPWAVPRALQMVERQDGLFG